MAFKPSYNIMDRDTHNALVNAFKTGGIAYTEDDGTVHKISDDYINGGGGGGGSDTVIVTETDGTLDITPNQLKAALAEGKRVLMYYENAEEGFYEQDFISTIIQNADNDIHTFSYKITFYEGGAHVESVSSYSSDGGDNPFVLED